MPRLSGLGDTKLTVRMMRGRDVRDRCKGRVDPNVLYVLEALAEQQHAIDKGMGEVALMIQRMADIQLMQVQVADNMKNFIDSHRRPDDDLGEAVS
jgi:hypothetical protein